MLARSLLGLRRLEPRLFVGSETGVLRRVILHRPDLELKRLTPRNKDALLFDDVLWVKRARQEHERRQSGGHTDVVLGKEPGDRVLHAHLLPDELQPRAQVVVSSGYGNAPPDTDAWNLPKPNGLAELQAVMR